MIPPVYSRNSHVPRVFTSSPSQYTRLPPSDHADSTRIHAWSRPALTRAPGSTRARPRQDSRWFLGYSRALRHYSSGFLSVFTPILRAQGRAFGQYSHASRQHSLGLLEYSLVHATKTHTRTQQETHAPRQCSRRLREYSHASPPVFTSAPPAFTRAPSVFRAIPLICMRTHRVSTCATASIHTRFAPVFKWIIRVQF